MSQLRVNNIADTDGTGQVSLTYGADVPSPGRITVGLTTIGQEGINAGVSTFTQLDVLSDLNLTGNISLGAGGTIRGGGQNPALDLSGDAYVTGVITATTFYGSAAGLVDLSLEASGEFNAGISSMVGVALTTGIVTAYSCSVSGAAVQIVHSIHVTNIGKTDANVYCSWGPSGTNYNYAYGIPVVGGGALELIRSPKILSPGEHINAYANIGNVGGENLQLLVTLEDINAGSAYFSGGVGLGTQFADLHVATADSMVQSVLLANDSVDAFDARATVAWTDGSDNVQYYFCRDLFIPGGASVEILEMPKMIPNGHKIRALSSLDGRVDASIAGRTVV